MFWATVEVTAHSRDVLEFNLRWLFAAGCGGKPNLIPQGMSVRETRRTAKTPLRQRAAEEHPPR